MKSFYKILAVASMVFSVVMMAGCDGSMGFGSPVDILKNSTGKELARGTAGQEEQLGEDPQRTGSRRDRAESAFKQVGGNYNDSLEAILSGNTNYRNLQYENVAPDGLVLPAYPIQVTFDVEGGYNVQMSFIVEQAKFLGPLKMNKLPIFNSAVIRHGDEVLTIDQIEVFVLALSINRDALKKRADQVWSAMEAKASQLAEKKKNDVAECERNIQEQSENFETDPSLPEEERDRQAQSFYKNQEAKISACHSK